MKPRRLDAWWRNPDSSSLAANGKRYNVPGGRVRLNGHDVFLTAPATVMSRTAGQVMLWAPGTMDGAEVDVTFSFPDNRFDSIPPEMLDWSRHTCDAVPVAVRRPERIPNADSGRKLPPARGFDGRFVKRRARHGGTFLGVMPDVLGTHEDVRHEGGAVPQVRSHGPPVLQVQVHGLRRVPVREEGPEVQEVSGWR